MFSTISQSMTAELDVIAVLKKLFLLDSLWTLCSLSCERSVSERESLFSI